MIVVDASAALEVLLQTPNASHVEARLFAPGESFHVPHLFDLEIIHGLRRYWLHRVIDDRRGQEAIEDLAAWPLIRHTHSRFLPRIWALRPNLTAYDAAYVALAESLNVPLITRDARLAASSGHQACIELL
jgi:predicted nucleic acid-binding protein